MINNINEFQKKVEKKRKKDEIKKKVIQKKYNLLFCNIIQGDKYLKKKNTNTT